MFCVRIQIFNRQKASDDFNDGQANSLHGSGAKFAANGEKWARNQLN